MGVVAGARMPRGTAGAWCWRLLEAGSEPWCSCLEAPSCWPFVRVPGGALSRLLSCLRTVPVCAASHSLLCLRFRTQLQRVCSCVSQERLVGCVLVYPHTRKGYPGVAFSVSWDRAQWRSAQESEAKICPCGGFWESSFWWLNGVFHTNVPAGFSGGLDLHLWPVWLTLQRIPHPELCTGGPICHECFLHL